jgi:hypothetical protein
MSDSSKHSNDSPAHETNTRAGGQDVEQVAAMNVAAAVRHAGLLLGERGKWELQAEEPFREPPYWLFEPRE